MSDPPSSSPASFTRLAATPFIIYSPSRTGSTTVQRLLNCHPNLRCLWEPFNPSHPAIFAVHAREILRTSGLDAALQYLATECNGFKHVWHPGGWPFDLNDRMLLHSDGKIIILRRINALQRTVSERISQQMKIWTIYTDADRRRIRRHTFQPLNIDQLRQDIAVIQSEERRLLALIASSTKSWRELTYEQLFSPTVSFDAAIAVMQSLFQFLGVPPLTDPRQLEAMRTQLDPAVTGFRNATAYKKIPNILEVDKALGNDEIGFIFEPHK